jgi:predicted transcriptional regulator
MTPSDQLRRIIRQSGMTRYQIAKASGVPQSSLSRFMDGKHTSTDTIDRLAKVLKLEIVTRNDKDKTKGR